MGQRITKSVTTIRRASHTRKGNRATSSEASGTGSKAETKKRR